MRIGIVRDVSQIHRKTEEAALAEQSYQDDVVESVTAALKDKYDVIDYVFDEHLLDKLAEDKIDLVFNLANGREDINDRTELPSLLKQAGIPHTGSGAMGHGVADDKALATAVLARNGIAHPETVVLESPVDLARLAPKYPVLVKPNNEGSSRGIGDDAVVRSDEELFRLVRKMFAYNDKLLVTEYIEGKEVTVGVIGNGADVEVLPAVEVDFSNVSGNREKIFSFEVKHEDDVEYHVPARLSDAERKTVEETAKKAFELLQIRDYCRVDMRIRDGKAYVLEVNALAGLHPESSDIIKMAKAAGYSYDAFIQKLAEIAIAREGLTDNGRANDAQDIAKQRAEENRLARKNAEAAFANRPDQKAKRAYEGAKDSVRATRDELERRGKEAYHSIEHGYELNKERWEEEYRRGLKDVRDKRDQAVDYLKDAANETPVRAAGPGWAPYGSGYPAQEQPQQPQNAPSYASDSDARYRALEARIHALEERIRILEQRR